MKKIFLATIPPKATVSFRLAEIDDADYILTLRLNSELSNYISHTDPSAEAQREWLSQYKEREREEKEFYFITTNMTLGKRCGVVRLYGINRGSCEWGSLILDENKTTTAGIESVLFINFIAFDVLKLNKAIFTTHKNNLRAIKLYKKLSPRIIGERITQIGAEHLFEIDKHDWRRIKRNFKHLLPRTT